MSYNFDDEFDRHFDALSWLDAVIARFKERRRSYNTCDHKPKRGGDSDQADESGLRKAKQILK